jgi:hypothetical protein
MENFGRRNIMSTIQNTVTDKFSIKSKQNIYIKNESSISGSS